MSTPTWREMTVEDVPMVLAMMEAFYAEDHLEFHPQAALSSLTQLLETPALGRAFILEAGDNPACGYLVLTMSFSLEFHGRYVLLDELYLVSSTRGQGLGKSALHFATNWAREQGVATLRLEVNHTNKHAKAVYLKSGFEDNTRDLLTRWLKIDE